MSYQFHQNGSPSTGTLTVSGPGGEYTADLDFFKIRSRNAYAEEAAALLGADKEELKRELIEAANTRAKKARMDKETGNAKPRSLKAEPLTAESRRAGEELAQREDILAEFRTDLVRGGFAGETKNAEILFLALCSRLLEKPVNVVPKGPSGGGKSFLVEKVLSYFPASAYLTVSSLSEHALAYIDEPLSHRFLIIAEAAGAEGQKAAYFLRTLLSEGRIEHQTNVKDPKTGRITPTLVKLEGPTGMITTTTAIKLHPENETRFVSLNVSDTEDQTRAIIKALCEEKSGMEKEAHKQDRSRWHALQERLEGAEHRVVIPFAPGLGDLISPKAVRLRRDISTLLSLIEAHAVLHQATRERDEKGRIIATLADYGAARRLIGESIDEGVESAVRKTVRETVDAVGSLVLADQSAETTSVKAVAEKLGLDRSAASRRIRQALDAGYLRNLEDKKGLPMRLVPGDPMPEDDSILPSCEQILDAAPPEGPEPPTTLAQVHRVAQSGVDKLDDTCARQNEALAQVHKPEDAGDARLCTCAKAQEHLAQALTPIDKGNTRNLCTCASQKEDEDANKAAEAGPDPEILSAPTVEGVEARAERDGRLLKSVPDSGSPTPPDHDELAEESSAGLDTAWEPEPKPEGPEPELGQEGAEPSREELINRVQKDLEARPEVAKLLGDLEGRLKPSPMASTLSYHLYGTGDRYKEVLPFVEERLREEGTT